MSIRQALATVCAIWLLLWLPGVRSVLERDMSVHMAVQIPLLIAVGALLAAAARGHEPHWFAGAD